MATVATVVIIGKCQNSHIMAAADRAKIAKSAAIFVRACDESVMQASPHGSKQYFHELYTGCIVKRQYGKYPKRPINSAIGDQPATLKDYPSMVSRRQCRAVNTISTNAMPSDAAADTPTSSAATGSSLSTLVINKCWLSDGMNINEL